MPQHNAAGDAVSAPHRESHASELHQARGQPKVSPTDHGEEPAAASLLVSIESTADGPASIPPAPARRSATAQANQRRVRIQSDSREQIDVDLLIQALLIVAEDMTAPSDLDDSA